MKTKTHTIPKLVSAYIYPLLLPMKLSSILKEIAILGYFVIFLKGSVVSLPMFVYLLFTVADFGTTQQVYSAIALLGLIIHFLHLHFKSRTKKVVVDLFVFICLLSPIFQKLFSVPLVRFNYTWFLIPAIGFVVLYITVLILRTFHAVKHHKETADALVATATEEELS